MSTKLTFTRATLLSHLRVAATKEKNRIAKDAQKAYSTHEKYIKDEIKKLESNLAAAKRGEPFYTVRDGHIYDKVNPAFTEPSASSKLLDEIDAVTRIINASSDENVVIALNGNDKFGIADLLRKIL